MKNIITTDTLYLVNKPHVYGMAIAWALQDVLGWNQEQIFKALMTAHTKGVCKLGEFANCLEIITKIETLLSEDGIVEKVVVQSANLPAKFVTQSKNDLVQKLTVIPEALELNDTKLLS